jgi:hypothetical protein
LAKHKLLKEKLTTFLGWLVLGLVVLVASANIAIWGAYLFGVIDYEAANSLAKAVIYPVLKVSNYLSMLK